MARQGQYKIRIRGNFECRTKSGGGFFLLPLAIDLFVKLAKISGGRLATSRAFPILAHAALVSELAADFGHGFTAYS